MKLFIISFVLIGLSLAGMAVGVMLKRGCLKGTCGGLNNLSDNDSECPYCGKTVTDRSGEGV
ncbi:MAG: ApbE family protein [Gammaproteobacteria bacterium]|nr:ApbE family protein [Gammaproteobacteria bacterium]